MLTSLRALWDEAPVPNPPARASWDWILVGTAMVVAAVEAAARPALALPAAAIVVLAPTLLWRRTHPLVVTAVTFLATAAVAVVADGAPVASVCFLVVPYAVSRWGSGRAIVVGTAIILSTIALSVAVAEVTAADAVGSIAVIAATMALGAANRYRARALARELEQVRLRERARLARDLHDTVAHHVTAMAIRAQAGRAASAHHPDAATDALKVIEDEAARALAELRAMVGTLREDDTAELRPVPTAADLPALARRRHDGPAVDLRVTGDVAAVPDAVGTAIYRMAQEAITNAQRHARDATRVDVRVTADDSSVRLSVSDDGAPGAGRRRTGFGIAGMVERAALLGGTCEAGPSPEGGGWTVTAVLPRDGMVHR